MTDTNASVSRDDIEKLVRLLGERPGGDLLVVSLPATTVDGIHEEPVTVQRATCEIASLREEDDEFDPEDHPELFEVEWKSVNLLITEPYEADDPKADRETARRIVDYLIERFGLKKG